MRARLGTAGFQLDFEANIVLEFEHGFTPVERIWHI
jgi:hypothetical protein